MKPRRGQTGAALWAELRHILIPFWGAGVIALIFGFTVTRGWPHVSRDWVGPALIVFGSFVSAHCAASLQEFLDGWAVNRPLRKTLHPGQFAFVFVGMSALALLALAMLAVSWLGIEFLTVDSERTKWSVFLFRALGGTVLVTVGLWVIAVPFRATFRWFGARQEQQRMRDDALFKLAKTSADDERAL